MNHENQPVLLLSHYHCNHSTQCQVYTYSPDFKPQTKTWLILQSLYNLEWCSVSAFAVLVWSGSRQWPQDHFKLIVLACGTCSDTTATEWVQNDEHQWLVNGLAEQSAGGKVGGAFLTSPETRIMTGRKKKGRCGETVNALQLPDDLKHLSLLLSNYFTISPRLRIANLHSSSDSGLRHFALPWQHGLTARGCKQAL